MKFVRVHKPHSGPALLNLACIEYFDLDPNDGTAVANLKSGNRVSFTETLYEIERICVRQGCALEAGDPPPLKPPPGKLRG